MAREPPLYPFPVTLELGLWQLFESMCLSLGSFAKLFQFVLCRA